MSYSYEERIEKLRAALLRIADENYEAQWELKDIARDALDADDATTTTKQGQIVGAVGQIVGAGYGTNRHSVKGCGRLECASGIKANPATLELTRESLPIVAIDCQPKPRRDRLMELYNRVQASDRRELERKSNE